MCAHLHKRALIRLIRKCQEIAKTKYPYPHKPSYQIRGSHQFATFCIIFPTKVASLVRSAPQRGSGLHDVQCRRNLPPCSHVVDPDYSTPNRSRGHFHAAEGDEFRRTRGSNGSRGVDSASTISSLRARFSKHQFFLMNLAFS